MKSGPQEWMHSQKEGVKRVPTIVFPAGCRAAFDTRPATVSATVGFRTLLQFSRKCFMD